MGMFDYVKYHGPLPKGKNSRLRVAMESGASQSKSVRMWEDPKFSERAYDTGCVAVTVTGNGTLLDPDMQEMAWSGDLEFYGDGPGHKGWHFLAKVKNGVVISIEKVKQ